MNFSSDVIVKLQEELQQSRSYCHKLLKENGELRSKLSEYASDLWVLQELRDRASDMDLDSYTDTAGVKWYASRITPKEVQMNE